MARDMTPLSGSRRGCTSGSRSAASQIQGKQTAQNFVLRYRWRVVAPTVGRGDGGVDLHDCLIVSLAAQRNARVVTFDAKAAKRLGMNLIKA